MPICTRDMRSPVGVPFRSSARATDDTAEVLQALASRAPATQSQASGLADLELSARIATALGVLLADVREILGRLSPIGDGSIENERHDLIAAALAKVTRGDRFASELLAYSGCQRLVPEAVELRPLLCSLADLLRRTLDRRIEVTVHVDDDCPPCRVDARALEEALLNLAINARDAMSHRGRMHFEARLAEPDNGAAVVALTLLDSGTGMTMDTSQRAALPHFTTKANDPLAGLGLAAVEGFVRQSGGSLLLQTWLGAGTVITLLLPCVERQASRPS